MPAKKQPVYKTPPIGAWSPSRLALYEECPRKARYKFVDKLPEPSAPALERGTAIHKGIEEYTLGTLKKLLPEAAFFKKQLDQVRKEVKQGTTKVELELAFDRSWQRVSWFAREAYVRLKADALRLGKGHAAVVDYKTGKVRDDANDKYREQIELYGIAAISANLAESAHGELWFTDHGVTVGDVADALNHRIIRLAEVPKLQCSWDRRASAMLSDTRFRPNPGYACRYCPWSQAKGGPCDY